MVNPERSPGLKRCRAFVFIGENVDIKQAKAKFSNQKGQSKRRGIAWELTFEQWLEWWGRDLDRRGNGPLDLQMCRHGDVGSYELGNIYKGTSKDNARTAGNVKRNRTSELAKARREATLNALMWAPSKESEHDDPIDEDVIAIARLTGNLHAPSFNKTAFAIDKNR